MLRLWSGFSNNFFLFAKEIGYAILKDMLDHPVFKMSFFFALIIGATIFLLGVSGYYDQGAAPGQEGALQKFFKFE